MTSIFLAILIGAVFGAVLDRVGATNPNYIVKMLNLTKSPIDERRSTIGVPLVRNCVP